MRTLLLTNPDGHRGRCSIVVSIPACHAGDPGSIPGNGVFLFLLASRVCVCFAFLFI